MRMLSVLLALFLVVPAYGQGTLADRIAQLEALNAQTLKDVATIKADIASIKVDVSELKAGKKTVPTAVIAPPPLKPCGPYCQCGCVDGLSCDCAARAAAKRAAAVAPVVTYYTDPQTAYYSYDAVGGCSNGSCGTGSGSRRGLFGRFR